MTREQDTNYIITVNNPLGKLYRHLTDYYCNDEVINEYFKNKNIILDNKPRQVYRNPDGTVRDNAEFPFLEIRHVGGRRGQRWRGSCKYEVNSDYAILYGENTTNYDIFAPVEFRLWHLTEMLASHNRTGDDTGICGWDISPAQVKLVHPQNFTSAIVRHNTTLDITGWTCYIKFTIVMLVNLEI